eukprot:1139943-Pelagomonas_calceolata.AAC.3
MRDILRSTSLYSLAVEQSGCLTIRRACFGLVKSLPDGIGCQGCQCPWRCNWSEPPVRQAMHLRRDEAGSADH